MMDVHLTPEQFARQSREQSDAFRAAMRRSLGNNDPLGVLASGWAADVATVQAVTAASILVSGEAPQRLYFQTAEGVTDSVRDSWLVPPDGYTSVADLLKEGRSALARSLEPAIVGELSDQWMELADFERLACPTLSQLGKARHDRLGGRDARDFVVVRKREASELALRAVRSLEQGDVEVAVRGAYAADMCALEAFLVQSATESGDEYLLTTRAWWDVIAAAISAIPGLPNDFPGSVATIRATIVTCLGEPAASRLRAMLPRH